MVFYRLVAGLVCVAIAATFVALAMAAWIVVIAVGLLHPRLTPRRSCDWLREFMRQSWLVVRALDPTRAE